MEKRGSFGQHRKFSQASEGHGSRIASEIRLSGGLSLVNAVDFGAEECLIVRTSGDKSVWAVGLSSGTILLISTESCALEKSLESPDHADKQSVTGLAFLRNGRDDSLLASYATGHVRLWRYRSDDQAPEWTLLEEALKTHEEPKLKGSKQTGKTGRAGKPAKPGKSGEASQILCLAGSCDGLRFVTGGVDGGIRVYDAEQHDLLTVCQSSHAANKVDGHRSRVCALVYHPLGAQYPAEFGRIFLSGGWDNTVQIWDDRQPRSLWAYVGPHVCGSDAIDIDPLQNLILTGSWERQKPMLQVWKFNESVLKRRTEQTEQEMLKTKPLGELQQDPLLTPSMGYVAQWLGDQYMLFGGSSANVLKIVDRSSLSNVGSAVDLPCGVYSMSAFCPDTGDGRRQPFRLAVAAGSRLYVMRFERK